MALREDRWTELGETVLASSGMSLDPQFEEDRRLLTPSQAAAYLGYTSTEVLKVIPVPPIRFAASGLGAGPRYDKRVLDRLIDNLSGLAAPPAVEARVQEDPFMQWRRRHGA